MPTTPPPTNELAELAAVLGDDNVRTLVKTYLRDFPVSLQELVTSPERKNRHRLVHSMKSNSRLMGAHILAQRMAALETRLAEEGGLDLNPDDLAGIAADFERMAGQLRAFAGD